MKENQITPLLSERQFLAAVLTGLPGLLLAYVLAGSQILDVVRGTLEMRNAAASIAAVAALLTVNPITLYLAARQFPRGKAIEGSARVAAQETYAAWSDTSLTK